MKNKLVVLARVGFSCKSLETEVAMFCRKLTAKNIPVTYKINRRLNAPRAVIETRFVKVMCIAPFFQTVFLKDLKFDELFGFSNRVVTKLRCDSIYDPWEGSLLDYLVEMDRRVDCNECYGTDFGRRIHCIVLQELRCPTNGLIRICEKEKKV